MAANVVDYRKGQVHPIVIDNGGTDSDWLDLGWQVSEAMNLLVYGPAALTNACKAQVSEDASTWYDLQSGGADIAITALEAIPITIVNARYFRVLSAGAEGAARTMYVVGHAS